MTLATATTLKFDITTQDTDAADGRVVVEPGGSMASVANYISNFTHNTKGTRVDRNNLVLGALDAYFDLNEHGDLAANQDASILRQSVNEGGNAIAPKVAAHGGYEFKGRRIKDGDDTVYIESQVNLATVTKTVFYVACYNQPFITTSITTSAQTRTVTYHKNCDDEAAYKDTADSYIDGYEPNLESIDGANTGWSRGGYTFAGWNMSSDGSGTTYVPATTPKLAPLAGDVELYAMWEATKSTDTHKAVDTPNTPHTHRDPNVDVVPVIPIYPEIPPTGDISCIGLCIVLFALSAMGICGFGFCVLDGQENKCK